MRGYLAGTIFKIESTFKEICLVYVETDFGCR